LQRDITVIVVSCGLGGSVENWERVLCAEGTGRRYIVTELVSGEAVEIDVLVS
jgi:hypothetical protein